MTGKEVLDYRFSAAEVKAFLLFVRRNEKYLDPQLEKLVSDLERFLYDHMTVEEAENFFS
jgi:hypothetical protein